MMLVLARESNNDQFNERWDKTLFIPCEIIVPRHSFKIQKNKDILNIIQEFDIMQSKQGIQL